MPYPAEVPVLSENHFMCGAGDRHGCDEREEHLKMENIQNCLMEYVNLTFGSNEEYCSNISMDSYWESVPKKVYQSIREAIIEVYGAAHVGLDSLDSIAQYISSDVERLQFSTKKDFMQKVSKIIDAKHNDLSKGFEKAKKKYVAGGSIIDANDGGCSIQNAKVWNLAMKKLGYEV